MHVHHVFADACVLQSAGSFWDVDCTLTSVGCQRLDEDSVTLCSLVVLSSDSVHAQMCVFVCVCVYVCVCV